MDVLKKFMFNLPTRIEYGVGVLDTVGEEARKLGGSKALLVSDKGVISAGLTDPILKSLHDAGLTVDIFDQVAPNPRDYDCVKGAEMAREKGTDILIAVGGGSSMDTAKTIGTLLAHGGKPQDWAGFNLLKKQIMPLICIPTTAGTGSEVTFFAVITDTEKKFKMNLLDAKLAARVALVDPATTLSLPPLLTASTGMDALTHAIEAYTCTLATPITDALALYAIKLISRSLKKAVDNGRDIEARSQMMLGSLIAGIAFGNSDVGGVHCMAEAVGGMYDTPHGIANSVLLPYVFEFNIPENPKKHADVAEAMGVDISGQTPEQAAKKGIEAIRALSKAVGIPRMKDIPGVDEKDFAYLAKCSAENVSADSNPRKAGAEEYLELFKKAYAGD
ncbi:MAG: iron-containing alcohol dehydrogenase [Bacillota bacterium]